MPAPIFVEYVHHNIRVVQQRPLATAQALFGPGRLIMGLLRELLHAAGDGLDLRIGLPLTDDETGRHAVLDTAEIDDADGLPLDFLYAFHDGGHQDIRTRTGGTLRCMSGGRRVGAGIGR